VSCGVLRCPNRDYSQRVYAHKTAEIWEWPRGGMVDTKDLKDYTSFPRIRSNLQINTSNTRNKDKVLCSAIVGRYE
jgi:hypothetical protein